MANAVDLLNQIWQSLANAATPPGNGFTLMNIATTGSDRKPKARFVILRDFSLSPEQIGFATHASSEKIDEIRANPSVAVTFYDRETSVQLRVEGVASVIEDDSERWRAWQNLAPHSQQQYASKAVPGDLLDSAATQRDDPSTAFQRFVWISIQPQQLDWLDLTTEPHQRWQFTRTSNGWNGQHVVP